MLKLRRNSDEETIINGIKKAIESCDAEELKSKKFIGLLYDYIPYEAGLKARLELMGRSGTLHKVIMLNEKSDKKLIKLMIQFSSTYGFSDAVTKETFSYVLEALGRPKIANYETQALEPITRQGSFSNKWINGTPQNTQTTEKQIEKRTSETPSRIKMIEKNQDVAHKQLRAKIENEVKMTPKRKKRWVRNPQNLVTILVFALLMLAGSWYMIDTFDLFNGLRTILPSYTSDLLTHRTWLIYGGVGLLALVSLPKLIHKISGYNVLPILPFIVLGLQVAAMMVMARQPELYEMLQIVLMVIILLGGVFSMIGSIRLPKGAKDFSSYKAISTYYMTGIVYFIGQYFVRLSMN